MKLTRADRRLLEELQRDATRNQAELAEITGMSRTSCWRRIRDFEEAGLIQRQVALLNPKKVGLNIQVLLLVTMTEHTDENRHSFEHHVSLLPEVTECFSVSGDRDYQLHVVVEDMESYNDFLNGQILRHAAVRSASSTFVLRRVKYSTELPVPAG
ncbi:MAG: Lrp/AsnC family transcriptional regulator [Gammaproteobacteria bacterium]|nr:Lrp/AsnC family transcriptional regulator [Gammaproteobacteria bacterium]